MNRFFKLLFFALISSYLFSQTTSTFYKFTTNTGINHIIGLPANLNPNINGTALAAGDEIGVFTNKGLCVGGVVWNGVATSIVAWADNPQTPAVDGFVDGNMYFRIYSKKVKKEYYATVEYSQPPAAFTTNGFSLLKTLKGTTVVGVENLANPENYKLSQNYPNPFNPSTKINFSISKSAVVSLTIFDLNGKEIARLLDSKITSSGSHLLEWNGRDVRGSAVSSGLYFYKLDVKNIEDGKSDFSQVKSMLLMK
jgi:hypothetical protein